MRHRNVHLTLLGITALGLLAMAPAPAGAQILSFTPSDWLRHRGTTTRQGGNADPGLPTKQVVRTWVYPGTADMPAEIVVDNTVLPIPAPAFPSPTAGYPDNTQDFQLGTPGSWTYPPSANRTGGAWPPTDPTFDKINDYVYTDAVQSTVLAAIGTSTLSRLPDLGDTNDQTTASNLYKQIHNDLVADTKYARWSFGTTYPYGTYQGTRRVSYINTVPAPVTPADPTDYHIEKLAPNQRYAVYIRYPSSGTFDGTGNPRPNVNHAMVRVSYGADPNDPITSRIFMVDFGQTGGTWVRIRSGAGDDRYFPYDGTNPIRVTLYSKTPDDPNNTDDFGNVPIIPADSVRLVPEALRGDIHASASSALFPLTNTVPNRQNQLTYFGRDETTGPVYITDKTKAINYPTSGFPTIPWDPTLPPQVDPVKANYNPLIADPTASIRSAVFYCIEDDLANKRYGKLRWRYTARTNPIRSVTVDDEDGAPFFTATNPALFTPVLGAPPTNPTNQPYGAQYQVATVTPNSIPSESVTWTQGLPDTTLGGTWSVYVWIPAGIAEDFAHFAKYQITTDQGVIEYILDQRNTDPNNANIQRTGQWRQLAGGLRFPGPQLFNGTTFQSVATVKLLTESQRDIDEGGGARVVVADAVQFVSESRTANSVVAAPLLANVKWPSGTERQVVYFATTDGHIWALDAIGNATGNVQSTNTTAYWVYPSISNPNPAFQNHYAEVNNPAAFRGEADDPNYNDDPNNNRTTRGVDGDLQRTQQGGQFFYTSTRRTPDLGGWVSSPMMVRVNTATLPNPPVYQQYIVIGNQNGRIYAFDPVGRVDPATNEPFANTAAGANTPGVPGTTSRLMTWPSAQRDKWLRKSNIDSEFTQYTDDPAKGVFQASPSAVTAQGTPAGADLVATQLISGASDGHVYAVDLSYPLLKPNERISHSTVNAATTDGKPLWLYPTDKTQLDPITQPGALSDDGSTYVFTAGGRVYSINTTPTTAMGTPNPRWVYPFTATPPNNPNPGDQVRAETEFTAPALRIVNNFNGGNEAAFIANKDGRIFAFDNSINGVGATPSANAPLWTSTSQGSTRASVTFINQLTRQAPYSTRQDFGSRILLPLDTGALIAVDLFAGANPGGGIVWSYFDALIGAVPLNTLPDPITGVSTLTFFATSNAYRGADAITANQWIFSGDEGNQDTGEVNGQMRAYGTEDIGLVTGGEPDVRTVTGGVELRLVDIWNGRRDPVPAAQQLWDFFGLPPVPANSTTPDPTAKSPYDEFVKGNQRKNDKSNGTDTKFAIYEWGDTIYMTAWGIYSGNVPPQVTFIVSGPKTQQIGPVGSIPDYAYVGPPNRNTLTTVTPGVGEQNATPFVAKAQFQLSQSNPNFSGAPGTQYKISAFAQITSGGNFSRTPTLSAGQFDPFQPNPMAPPAWLPPRDPNDQTPPGNPSGGGVGAPRLVAIAHPYAVSTRGMAGLNQPNAVGWTNGLLADNSNMDFTEIMTNGNSLTTFNAGVFVPTTLKDLIAPLGFATHGSSIAYNTIDNAGASGPGLMVADRSNLYKLGQRLNRVRVERREMRWGWNRNTGNAFIDATGNVMNPLPWETFPNTVPNVSPDYPDVAREHATFKFGDQNMGARGITLHPPVINGNVKTLVPTTIDLTVDVPKYQPANINGVYYDINGLPTGPLLAPMNRTTGVPGAGQASSTSAGYVGSYAIFVDDNDNGVFDGFAPGVSAGQRVVLGGNTEVFRQINVGVSIPPDVNLRTEEETVDVGTVPHSEGYSPLLPFQPSYLGSYAEWTSGNVRSPWDKQFGLYKPFTVRNQGNVNLVNVRVAKVQAPYNPLRIGASNYPRPDYWLYMNSDQVQQTYTYNNTPLAALSFNMPGFSGQGNLGVVTSLDHKNDANNNDWENDLWTWNNALTGYVLPSGVNGLAADYVINGNPLGWTQFTRRRPTIGKPRPNDSAPRTMSIPDTYYGDPLNVLGNITKHDVTAYSVDDARSFRPQISVAIPLGTPAGTYTMPVYVFEDHVPEQWRSWLVSGVPNPVPLAQGAGDDDGMMNTVLSNGGGNGVIPEAFSNPFTLKVTVAEARLTNGSTAGSFIKIDNRATGAGLPLGANIQPAAMRDVKTGNLSLFWPSNRVWDTAQGRWVDPGTPDAPWYLFSTQLNTASTVAQSLNAPVFPYFDWQYETGTGNKRQWWNLLTQPMQYPTPSLAQKLFPSQISDILPSAPQTTPLVPGVLNTTSVRHATPALIQDDDPNNGTNLGTWLFWQAAATKSSNNGGTTGANFTTDTRTFYVPLQNGFAPDPATTAPFSFLNDPGLPKFAPKPLIVTDPNQKKVSFLFWYGNVQGRTRLYYNSSTNLTNVTSWSSDTLLQTPGTLQSVADPTPIHRRIFTTWFNPQGETLDCVDLVYTGVLANRKQSETILTRYALEYPRDAAGAITNQNPTGKLIVMPIGVTDATPGGFVDTPQTAWKFGVVDELLSRQGPSGTFAARDLAWITSANRWDTTTTPNRFRRDMLDAAGKPYIQLRLVDRANNSTNLLLTNPAPVFDSATGKVYYASALGGQIAIDPQGGTLTFEGVTPKATDKLLLSYTPQSLRINVSRNDTGALAPPAGNETLTNVPWANDAGFTPRTHLEATGSNSGPVTFLDRNNNPRWTNGVDNTVGGVPGGTTTVPVTRLWTFFRKSDADTAAASTIYYKTMRLMVRLPRGVVRNPQPNWSPLANISVTGNTGPYEVDWVRGRVYFTEQDEGKVVTISFTYARTGNMATAVTMPATQFRVMWGDEISSALTPGDSTTNERILPLSTPVNEGQISAFKDPYQDKVWIFWSSTKSGTTDLYYMAINPQFYTQLPGF